MLEKATYVALSVTALVLAYASLTGRMSHSTPLAGEPAVLQRGSHAPRLMLRVNGDDSVPAIAAEKNTLVVFLSTECPYCLASLGSYRKLASTRCDIALSFVVLDRQGQDLRTWWSENAWSQEHQPECSDVKVGSPTRSVDLFGRMATPTQYLLDPDGEVLQSQLGAMLAIPDWLGDSMP